MKKQVEYRLIDDYSVLEAKENLATQTYKLLHVLQLNHVLQCAEKNIPCSYGINLSKEEAMNVFIKFNRSIGKA